MCCFSLGKSTHLRTILDRIAFERMTKNDGQVQSLCEQARLFDLSAPRAARFCGGRFGSHSASSTVEAARWRVRNVPQCAWPWNLWRDKNPRSVGDRHAGACKFTKDFFRNALKTPVPVRFECM